MILTRRQWVAFLFLFVLYILLGALVFYSIESEQSAKRHLEEETQKQDIDDLIIKDYKGDQYNIFNKISIYCDKPLGPVVPETHTKIIWSFYHAIFFVLTIVSTIGYGSLSPTTTFTRIFMIVYGMIGIPMNGIVIITLGEYFGTKFKRIYRRWRTKRDVRVHTTLGLIARLVGYSIPGLIALIVIPSCIIVLYEGWSYDVAIEFAFGTLTTIGSGQYIPGTMQNGHDTFVFILYKTFLIIWIITGLGYLAMFFNFISQGLQSKKMFALENKLSQNIKKTNKKIRKELQYLLNEYLFTQTYAKPVYRERRLNTVITHQRTQSCPNLLHEYDAKVPFKKRAISAMPPLIIKSDCKMKSDTDLENIDKSKSFEQNVSNQHSELLIKVVNTLANYNDFGENSLSSTYGEINEGFESDEFGSHWIIEKNPLSTTATATVGAINPLAINNVKSKLQLEQECVEYEKYGRTRSRTLPPIQQPESLFTKFKRTLRKSITGDKFGIEHGSKHNINLISEKPFVQEDVHVNDDNSLSDFLRALSIINFNEISRQAKEETNFSPNPSKTRRLPIIPSPRRLSLNSTTSSNETRRRYSESCSSTTRCIRESFSTHPPRRRKKVSVIGVVHRIRRSTPKHKNSVVINIDN